MQANIANARERWANARERWAEAKLTKTTVFWIVIGAILLTMFLGFSRGGWMTGGAAQKLSERTAQTAVIDRLEVNCLAQFSQDSQRDESLAKLKALTTTSQRRAYVIEQGWATMPGEEKADNKVASQCAEQLVLMNE